MCVCVCVCVSRAVDWLVGWSIVWFNSAEVASKILLFYWLEQTLTGFTVTVSRL